MKRRNFLVTSLSAMSLGTDATSKPHRFDLDDTSFRSLHEDGRLHCSFTAPTQGWLAVGFNDNPTLEGTRFVIGAMIAGAMYVEEHIAVVPSHPKVQDLGLEGAVGDVTGDLAQGRTTLQFSLPHLFSDTGNPTLLPGTSSNLMLAWSHEVDFAHHSAWRRHAPIQL